MTQSSNFNQLDYNPHELPRELLPNYIGATEIEQKEMLAALSLNNFDDLYAHIPHDVRFKEAPFVTQDLSYNDLIAHMKEIESMNHIRPSFIGSGLKNYSVHPIVPYICSLRNLTTAYTPYQPERSQGTLHTLWNYASALSMLTGFEAINASFYDRSTCLYEAMNTALRLVKNTNTILVAETIFHKDIEVLRTHAESTGTTIVLIPMDKETGLIDLLQLEKLTLQYQNKIAAIVFPQVNTYGNLEDVHALTDFAFAHQLKSIAVIDPKLLATEGLVPPALFGKNQKGADMIVGEGQHLAIAPNFGGPGLGIFGIRYNEENKNDIRQTAGRFIGKARDSEGKDCLCMVLSTREQHIRREKATSNICSNQSFVASIAGASILAFGETGMTESHLMARDYALQMAQTLTQFEGVKLAYPATPFYNEFVLELPVPAKKLIDLAREQNIHLGVDVSQHINDGRSLLLISFFDIHTDNELEALETFFNHQFKALENDECLPEIPANFKRDIPVGLPDFDFETLKSYYKKLNDLNVSPDDAIYPLGSCTMKYNPYINDWAASLPGFTQLHPEAPFEDAQGSLKILFEIQEMFKSMTGLSGVTTEPVAGAQGELVGLKLFQAYHRDHHEEEQRQIILIPKSAHGTNPATATMAGYQTKIENGATYGIVVIDANENGQINMTTLKELVATHGKRIAGIMVTNPNTSGIFETEFKAMSDLIHSVGGLVYMDGANMNAIAGQINLNALGVDAVHNNLHKTWSIPHGGGGPGDGIVAVSEKLLPYLPGIQIKLENGLYVPFKTPKSIGSFHRHFGNFAHKVRAYTYLKRLGGKGVRTMSAMAVLSARYLYEQLKNVYPILPEKTESVPRMHEFILTLSKETFDRIEKKGTPKAQVMAKTGKLFLDFGGHAPTVAFPEVYGLMIEPTETYSKKELDQFVTVVKTIHHLLNENPEVLLTAPHFTPVKKVDEVYANKDMRFMETIHDLNQLFENKIDPLVLTKMSTKEICQKILSAT